MAKTSSQFVCSECGWSGPKWLGRCPECGQWGTIEEFHEARPSASSRTAAPGRTSRTLSHAVPDSAAKPITEISTENISRIDTGFTEFNRVLGGGIVPGSVTLIAGEPGIGKSTLLLETAGNVARLSAAQPERNTVLYISGEESQAQVRMRASRIGAVERPVNRAGAYRTMQACAGHRRFRANHRLAGSRWHLRRLDSGARSGERADRHRQNA